MFTVVRHDRPFGLQAVGEVFGTVVVTVFTLVAAGVLVGGLLMERRRTGRVSALSRWAARAAEVAHRPVWEPLPFVIVLGGLAVALLGWRSLAVDGPLQAYGVYIAVAGLTLAVLGGVLAGALAHPPTSVVEREEELIAHPVPAHRTLGAGKVGAGPASAVVIAVAGMVALLVIPVATVWRFVAGGTAANSALPHHVVLIAVGVLCLGAWGLAAEARVAQDRSSTGAAGRGLRAVPGLADAAAATAVLLVLSVMVDSGLPTRAAGIVGAVVLLAARVRGGGAAALTATFGYLGIRLLAATLTWTFTVPLVPSIGPAVVAALVIEAVALAVAGVRGHSTGLLTP